MDAIVRRPSLRALALVFARYGNSTFGGGTATIVRIEREVVDGSGWLEKSDSHLVYAISRLTPGTNLLAYCVGAGWRMRGVAGALTAVIAASVPSAAMAVALTRFFGSWPKYPLSAPVLRGALAAAIAIMIGTVWTLLHGSAARSRRLAFAIAGGAFLLSFGFRLTPIPILVTAAVIGALWPDAAPAA